MHAYDRDKFARLLHDRGITLADDIDGLVRRFSTAYTLRGQVASVSSHDDPTPGQGNVLNEVAFSYNALRCLTADRQGHNGPVDCLKVRQITISKVLVAEADRIRWDSTTRTLNVLSSSSSQPVTTISVETGAGN